MNIAQKVATKAAVITSTTTDEPTPTGHRYRLADICAGSLLLMVELGFLAVIIRLGLIDPHQTFRLPSDWLNYEPMASSFYSNNPLAHHAPFCWRVLTPWLVYGLTTLGLSLHGGFLLVTTIGLCGTIIVVYALLRLCGATTWQALAIAMLIQTQYVPGLLGLWNFVVTDPLSYLLLGLAFLLYWRNRPRWLMVVLALAALNRETALFAVAAFAGEQVIHRDWKRLKSYLPAYVVPGLIILTLHVAIFHVGSYNLINQVGATWSIRTGLVGRGSTQIQFGNVNAYALNIYHLTINAFGLLLPLLLLQFIHPPYVIRRPEVWIFLLVTIVQIIFATDDERLMFIAFPVVALAAWHELRWLAQCLKLPAAVIGFFLVCVQGLFLMGQFYKAVADFSFNKTVSLQEPRWLNELWLGMLMLIIVATVGAILWIVGFGIRRLYLYAQA